MAPGGCICPYMGLAFPPHSLSKVVFAYLMKLLDDLITSLSGEHPNLTDSLMKTKVLLHKLGRKDLAEWVNLELTGYPDSAKVPEYRVIHSIVKGVVTNGVYRYNDQPLPTLHLDESARNRLENLEMQDSISVLEGLAQKDKGSLSRPIPLEFNSVLGKPIIGGYHVERAWCEVGFGQVAQILTQVRSRLLDFLLELNEKVVGEMSDDDVKRLGQSPETASMFNHAIFGDNVTILVGNQNTQTVTNQITRGDFEALSAFLRQHNVPSRDIEELRSAIQADTEADDLGSSRHGPNVNNWVKDMLGKAIDTSWKIELGVAANLLTDALRAYYG